jgi:putative transposase
MWPEALCCGWITAVSQYLSVHFVNQVRFWGIHPCFTFVEQPQTNGVVERFNRTLKEQAI